MAYSRENLLKRIIEVQETYLREKKEGVSVTHVYNNYIYPKYLISRATFYKYLAINAKKEIKELRIQKNIGSETI